MSTAHVDTAHRCLQHIDVYSIRRHSTSMSTAYVDTARPFGRARRCPSAHSQRARRRAGRPSYESATKIRNGERSIFGGVHHSRTRRCLRRLTGEGAAVGVVPDDFVVEAAGFEHLRERARLREVTPVRPRVPDTLVERRVVR
eukprot:2961838-Pyramimonas_sp.AAC.1